MPSASSRNRWLVPFPHWTFFTSECLRMSIPTSFCLLGRDYSCLQPCFRRRWGCPQLDEEGVEIFDDVTSVGKRVRDAGDAGAADDGRVGADRAEAFDVVPVLDAEADGNRDVGALAQVLEDRRERTVVGRPDGAALAVRRDEVDVGGPVVARLFDHFRL